ncbi:alpha-1,2-fucosyltransferase [Desertivirga arenae]|uniref:alpha-1,2-fucosyltransferase n=1 Tax=Desertivirga arenae TaxID=2810309 RepID=UPI001A97BA3D|nr:alpha-1,2-fucosyltransferase [Pedobacter sp. SYSU D00823]
MSQYAFYLNKKRINRSTYIINFCSNESHNGFELDKVFNIRLKKTPLEFVLLIVFKFLLLNKYITRPIRAFLKLLGCNIIFENFDYTFNSEYLSPSNKITFYYGGWHLEKYFSFSERLIRETFKFRELRANDLINIGHVNEIRGSNSVSIHVRRGDYLNNENASLFGGVCTLEYFMRAIQLIKSEIDRPHFFVFSNDMKWVKENLLLDKVTYVTNNKDDNSWKDMYLMSICKHNIISNSTFSWWAAWLNNYDAKIVISPSKFLATDTSTDFYPESWTRIDI